MMKPVTFAGVYHLTYEKADEPGRFDGWDNFNWFGLGERRGVKKAFRQFLREKKAAHRGELEYLIESYPVGKPNQRLVVDGPDVDRFWKTRSCEDERLFEEAWRASRRGEAFSSQVRDPMAEQLGLKWGAFEHAKLIFLKLADKLDVSDRYPRQDG